MKQQLSLLLLTLAGGACIGPFGSDSEDVARVDQSVIESHVRLLAADSLFGRLNGSRHELQAAEYIRDMFVEYGVEPGAPDFFDNFNFQSTVPPRYPTCDESAIRNPPVDPQRTSQNVVGILPGEGSLATEWIVVGAHYDHLGCRNEIGRTVVYNGADDNASGTAMMLELARVLAAGQGDAPVNRRSIMFHAYGAEEVGLWGSRSFVNDPTVSLNDIVAMVNLDMVGRLRTSVTVFGVVTATGWEDIINRGNEGGLDLRYDYTLAGGSDHVPFMQSGVPAVFIHTGLHGEYHQPDDDYQLLNYEGMAAIAEMLQRALTILMVVDQPPAWVGVQ